MAKSFHHNQALRADKAKPLQGDPSFPLWHGAYRGLWNVASFLLARGTPSLMHRWRWILLFYETSKPTKWALL